MKALIFLLHTRVIYLSSDFIILNTFKIRTKDDLLNLKRFRQTTIKKRSGKLHVIVTE
jgi:hypothetical protein